MSSSPGDLRGEQTLAVAEQVLKVLGAHGVAAAVIGAMAMAAHLYPRSTEDFDLGTSADPFTTLRAVAAQLEREGYEVELNEPDAEDPRGGVLNVRGAGFDLVQVVNFHNPYRPGSGALAEEALREATLLLSPGMRVVSLPHLVALKLYAGGRKSFDDVCELLERNSPVDVAALRDVCGRHGLGPELDNVLGQLGLTG